MSDHFCALRKPILDLISIVEQITDALDCDTGDIGRCFVHFSISLENFPFFELFLDLFSCSDKCDTIHGCHDSLFDYFSVHFAFETLCDLDKLRPLLILNVSEHVL